MSACLHLPPSEPPASNNGVETWGRTTVGIKARQKAGKGGQTGAYKQKILPSECREGQRQGVGQGQRARRQDGGTWKGHRQGASGGRAGRQKASVVAEFSFSFLGWVMSCLPAQLGHRDRGQVLLRVRESSLVGARGRLEGRRLLPVQRQAANGRKGKAVHVPPGSWATVPPHPPSSSSKGEKSKHPHMGQKA